MQNNVLEWFAQRGGSILFKIEKYLKHPDIRDTNSNRNLERKTQFVYIKYENL